MSISVNIFAFFDFSQKVIVNLFCTICIALGYFLIQCVVRYQAKKTGTVDEYRSIDRVQFPEISICSLDRYKLSSKDTSEYLTSHKWVPAENNIGNNMTASEYYSKITYSPTDLVSKVRIVVRKAINRKERFYYNTTSQPICGKDTGFDVKPTVYYGDCTTFSIPSCFHNAHPAEIKLYLNHDVTITVHHRHQFTDVDSQM
jgi:hypothetical protein